MNNLDLLIPSSGGSGDSWLWATVTGIGPLRIRLDGDDTSLTVTPDSLVKDLVVGNRVWVQLAGRRVIIHGASATQGAVSPLPVGTVQMYAANPTNAPEGWLYCKGGTFSSTTYPALAALLGDTYGTHSGTTYYLPDFRARSPIGIGGAAVGGGSIGNVYSLGQKYGHESMQTHTHTQDAHSHSVYDPSHSHGVHVGWNEEYGGHNWTFGTGGSNRNVNLFTYIQSDGAYTGISLYNATATNQNSGSGNAGNVHPVLGMNFIIKT